MRGGAWSDTMNGGADADTVICDGGTDLIDVSNIDEEASLLFLGTGAFTGSGDMEICCFQNLFGATFVQFDENGDGVPDGALILLNTPGAVTADDFVL